MRNMHGGEFLKIDKEAINEIMLLLTGKTDTQSIIVKEYLRNIIYNKDCNTALKKCYEIGDLENYKKISEIKPKSISWNDFVKNFNEKEKKHV